MMSRIPTLAINFAFLCAQIHALGSLGLSTELAKPPTDLEHQLSATFSQVSRGVPVINSRQIRALDFTAIPKPQVADLPTATARKSAALVPLPYQLRFLDSVGNSDEEVPAASTTAPPQSDDQSDASSIPESQELMPKNVVLILKNIQETLLDVQTLAAKVQFLRSGLVYSSERLELNEEPAVQIVKAMAAVSQDFSHHTSGSVNGWSMQDDMLTWLLIDSIRRNSTFLAAHWILKGASVDAVDHLTGRSVLQMAVVHQMHGVARLLMEGPVNWRVVDGNSNSLLHLIARYGGKRDWSSVGRMLIANGAPVDEVNDQDQTALHIAAESRNLLFLQFLLRNGASVQSIDSQGRTPLHLAVTQHQAARILLGKGAKVDPLDEKGRTPLHWAAIKGNADSARVLLFFKADGQKRDSLGRIPFDYADELHRHEDIRVILSP